MDKNNNLNVLTILNKHFLALIIYNVKQLLFVFYKIKHQIIVPEF